MYDYTTTNRSFIETSERLKNRGVKNSEFMFELYNDNLQSVDPFSPNISDETKKDIIEECKNNIWYFFREILRIPNPGGGTSRFKLDLTSCAQIYCFTKNINCWISKPRMLGSTLCCLSLGNYTRIFHSNSKTYFCGRSKVNNRSLKEKSNAFIKALPEYLQLIDINNDNTVEVYTYRKILDEIQTGYLFIDDAEFVPKINALYEKLKEKCKSYSTFYKNKINSIQLASTISDDIYGAEALLSDSIQWSDLFYDIEWDLLVSHILSSTTGLIHIYNSYKDLGLDENWFKTMRTLLQNNKDIMRMEVLLKRKNEI